MKICENGHVPCSFTDYHDGYVNSCPACKAKEKAAKVTEKTSERIRQLENEIDHLFVCVVNQKWK